MYIHNQSGTAASCSKTERIQLRGKRNGLKSLLACDVYWTRPVLRHVTVFGNTDRTVIF
jgi:hypothetical protein